jgi:diguanylate cyclase (GGDEF)-like protein
MFTPDDLRLFTVISDLAAAAAENARLYQHAQELAITDGLTGLYLRRFFNQRFDEELMRFQEHGTPFTLLILDLDHFKRINDRLGHVAGDQILIQVADILKKEARIADITCRFGGEEFALILPNTPAEGGLIMAERIRVKIAERGFLAGSEAIQLTVSIGLGECPRHGRNQLDLVKSADEALYTAKRTGRNNAMMAVSRRKKS